MIAQVNDAIKNQKHLNLDIIPEEKMKKQGEPKKDKAQNAKKAAPAPRRGASRNSGGKQEVPAAPKRNRGIRRR